MPGSIELKQSLFHFLDELNQSRFSMLLLHLLLLLFPRLLLLKLSNAVVVFVDALVCVFIM